MLQVIDSIPEPPMATLADIEEKQVVLNLTLSYQSLVDVITKLGLRELIQLRRSLDQQIDHALESYTGDDELILDEIQNYRLISEDVKPLAENPANKEVIEDFRQAWHEAMTGQTIPVSQLWEEIG